jgi:excisionase family DNA binding protein
VRTPEGRILVVVQDASRRIAAPSGMTTSAVARFVGVDPSTIRRAVERGELRAVRTTKRDRRFDRRDVGGPIVWRLST